MDHEFVSSESAKDATMPTKKSQVSIPAYLRPYVSKQNPALYTPMDHASWRFILKLSKSFFAKNAHQIYLDGLKRTGISTESIPLIRDMDRKLSKFGWRAVPVTGFIPPAAFMEFLSLGILPIACDMRTLDHLAYTPAPDVVHEAAGHAPIIADPEYADYLRSYGEISKKAIFSDQDMQVYEAIRFLSDTKEDPQASPEAISLAQQNLDRTLAAVTYVSEATLLSRMAWWTFEYGLVGSVKKPKIFGAGLLSSVAESYRCLRPEVKKIPFSLDCIQTSYDITKPQPQLFVARDFKQLKKTLIALGKTMAFSRGGLEGVAKAVQSKTVTTSQLDSGIQISGVLTEFIQRGDGSLCFLKWDGPVQLSYEQKELPGQGVAFHRSGFSSILEPFDADQISPSFLKVGRQIDVKFKSGIALTGRLKRILKRKNQIVLLTFVDCKVEKEGRVLFLPDWGTYDVVCGKKVVSVFGGAADRARYFKTTLQEAKHAAPQKTNLTPSNKELNQLYHEVRKIRESRKPSRQALLKVEKRLNELSHSDWLLRYEILELLVQHRWEPSLQRKIRTKLDEVSHENLERAETVGRGLSLLN